MSMVNESRAGALFLLSHHICYSNKLPPLINWLSNYYHINDIVHLLTIQSSFMTETYVFLESFVAEIELRYIPHIQISKLPCVRETEDAYEFFIKTWDKEKLHFVEQFRMMLLNASNRVLGICTISTGTTSYTMIDKKLLFATALKANASKIIIAHNHPSGSLCPSSNDITITKRIKEAGKFMDIPLVDHLIVTEEGFYSFAEEEAL